MKYYVVRAIWSVSGSEKECDYSEDFIKKNIWENGWGKEKFEDVVNGVNINDVLILADRKKRILSIGKCTHNSKNAKNLGVYWFLGFKDFQIDIISSYQKTINNISDENRTKIINKAQESNNGLKEFLENPIK